MRVKDESHFHNVCVWLLLELLVAVQLNIKTNFLTKLTHTTLLLLVYLGFFRAK